MKQIAAPSEASVLTFLASCSLFQGVETSHLRLVASELRWYRVEDGETFIRQDRPAGSIYLVAKGQLEVFSQGKDGGELILARPGPGDTVGELALLSGDRREASVRAISRAVVARFARSRLVRLSVKDPSILGSITEAVRRRLRRVKLAQLLSTGDLFSDLSESVRRDLSRELEWINLEAGEDFIHQGDRGDFLGMVVSGRLRVIREELDGGHKFIGELGKGATVGKMALLTGGLRTATVRAARDAEVVKLSQAGFHRLVSRHPLEMTRVFAGGVIELLWKAAEGQGRPTSHITTVAIVPAAFDVPVDSFSEQLTRALSELGSTRYLSSQLVDSFLETEGIAQTPPDGINNGRLVAWLNAQEHRFEYVLYQTDPRATPWSDRCIRQADLVLIVGRGKGKALCGRLEKTLLAEAPSVTKSQQVLVLIHEDGVGQPKGTAAWLKERPGINRHYHVRRNRPSDYERLARSVAGRAVGLVLSGGGARGAAHIGVLQALEEAGLAIDHIGGNSAGSVVAAAYATGRSPAEIPDLIKQAYKPGNFFDPTIPLFSLFAGRRGANYYRKMLGEFEIEDLWSPFFCVSSNLTMAEIMVHDHGPLWRSVLASNSAPGLRPPVVHEGDLLLDGALLDDLPLDVMREKIGSGTVIAVDVSPLVDLAENPDYGDSISGWRILWNRLNPLSPSMELPSIAAILQRASELSSKRAQRTLVNARMADLYIRPPVEHFSMMDNKGIDEMVTVAYDAARKQIVEWQGALGSDNV